MDQKIIDSGDPKQIRKYIDEKFAALKKSFMTKAKRRNKVIAYWLAAEYAPVAKGIIEERYTWHFKESFPRAEAEKALQQKNNPFGKQKINANEHLQQQKKQLNKVSDVIQKLETWQSNGDWQDGDEFFFEMKDLVTNVDTKEFDDTFSPLNLHSEFDHGWKQKLTHSSSYEDKTGKAEFDAMLGYQQKASVSFEAFDPNWGEISAKIDESFKAGLWTSGNVKAKLQGLNLTAEVAAALAIGAQLDVKGDCKWKKGKLGLDLDGTATAFAGASANLKAKFSANALKGLDIAIKAGAFAGVKASIKGNFKMHYDGEELFGGTATASVSAGVGGGVDLAVSAPIFGSTVVSVGANLSVGLGAGADSKLRVNFNGIYLAGRAEFRKVVYLKTISKGYKMDLMNSDVKNLHYLEKSIKQLKVKENDLEEVIESSKQNPMKQNLLVAV